MHVKTVLGLSFTLLAVVIPLAILHLEERYESLLAGVVMFALATTSALLTFQGARTVRSWILGVFILVCNGVLVVASFFLLTSEPSNIISANESRVAATLHLLAVANIAYAEENHHYVKRLQDLKGSPVLQDTTQANEAVSKESAAGYIFNYSTPTNTGFQITASPQKPGRSGNKFFYVDQKLTVHYDQTKPATAQSLTIGD